MPRLSRREFLAGAGAAGAVLATGSMRAAAGAASRPAVLPAPSASGIEHIVMVCMENRSFDHFLGWIPGADGRQQRTFADDQGELHDTYHLTEWSGCGFNDPDHSYLGGRLQLNGGKLDGFRRGANDDFALGYYDEQDLPTTSQLVRHFTTFDRWFCPFLGPTYPNRLYTHTGTTDRVDNSFTSSTLPTIWDRLSDAGVSARYYFSDLPAVAFWGTKYIPISRPVDTFFVDAAAGSLASFTYVDPLLLGEDQGGSNDDHPHADIRRGQSFVASVVNAVLSSPLWSSTVLVITYDEWGGFFDHVVPPIRPDLAPLVIGGRPYDRTQAGFRVPAYVISPFARPGRVDHAMYDHTSILRMVQWRWGLKGLHPRDRSAHNLAYALDFGYRNKTTPIPSVPDPGPHYCRGDNALTPLSPGTLARGVSDAIWYEFRDSPLMKGWPSGR